MPDGAEADVAYVGTASAAGRGSPASGRSRASCARRSRTLYESFDELAVAGRTDTGVHALANVVSVDVTGGPPVGARGRGAERGAARRRRRRRGRGGAARPSTPASRASRARTATASGAGASARRSSTTARSGIRARSTSTASNEAAALLLGEHDFRAFTPTDTQHDVFVRVVESARWHDRGDTVELELTADSFLRHMVRTLVGTMLEREPAELAELLQRRAALGGGLDRAAARPVPDGRLTDGEG